MNIWPWSRIRELEQANRNLNRRLEQWEEFLAPQLIGANRAMGRLIAKLDPEYGRSEFDPQRKRESDELSDQIIRKMIAEHTVSKPPEGSF